MVYERELKNTTRHGHVAVSFPYLYIFNKRVASIMAQLFVASDTVVASVPALFAEDRDIDEDEIMDDELGRKGREVLYTFTVENMWKTYGKAPFGV